MESPLLIEFKGSDRQSSLFLNMQQQGTRAVTEHNYGEKQSERQSGESDTAASGCAKIHVAVVNATRLLTGQPERTKGIPRSRCRGPHGPTPFA